MGVFIPKNPKVEHINSMGTLLGVFGRLGNFKIPRHQSSYSQPDDWGITSETHRDLGSQKPFSEGEPGSLENVKLWGVYVPLKKNKGGSNIFLRTGNRRD